MLERSTRLNRSERMASRDADQDNTIGGIVDGLLSCKCVSLSYFLSHPATASEAATSGGMRIALPATNTVAATPLARTKANTETACESNLGAGTPYAVL